MKRTDWLIVLSIMIAVIGGFATYAADVEASDRPIWLAAFALRFKDRALFIGWSATILIALLQGIQAWVGRPAFRRQTVQRVLDVLVSECAGVPKKNRITLFKRAKGWKVLSLGLWRLKGRYWKEEKKKKLRALWQLEWFADYLYVYARSSQARAQMSTAAFRVSHRESECGGVAGSVWEYGFVIKANLPKIRPSDLHIVKSLSWEQILALPRTNRLKAYIEDTRITGIEQLLAIETFAQHFVGHIIRTGSGTDWGVLLLDSEEDECPFAHLEEEAGTFGRVFRTHAETIGNILGKG